MASSWIWQQPDWPRFRWDSAVLDSPLGQARAARQELLIRLETLEPTLNRDVISALLGRESLGTAAIEGELLDPAQVRSSIARRLRTGGGSMVPMACAMRLQCRCSPAPSAGNAFTLKRRPETGWRISWMLFCTGSPLRQQGWTGCCGRAWPTCGF